VGTLLVGLITAQRVRWIFSGRDYFQSEGPGVEDREAVAKIGRAICYRSDLGRPPTLELDT